MGYDLVVLDSTGRVRLGHGELSLNEQAAIEDGARASGLRLLSALPAYWGGDEGRISVEHLAPLITELGRLESGPEATAETRSAAHMMRGLAEIALEAGQPLLIVPD